MHYPAFKALDLPPGTFTWGVGERAAYLGAMVPSYARAAEGLAYLTNITISPSELTLCTEGMGTAYRLPERPPMAPVLPTDVVYVETDAVMLHFRDVKPWHEEKVFCTWHETAGVTYPPRYWTADGPWDSHLAALETLTAWEGLAHAGTIVCLGDGSHPLWDLLTALAPHALQVVDWYHVQEHLATVAEQLPDGKEWHKKQRDRLKLSQSRDVMRDLLVLVRSKATEARCEAARKCFGYLWYHRTRLDYALAMARGYPIGSGRIESACKLVVQQRCKGPGMRWGHPQANAVLHARCAWLNEDWARACKLWRITGAFAPPQSVSPEMITTKLAA
jgi:hypothetical protein